MSAWSYLALAGAFEIAFAISMKFSHGFTHLGATLVTGIAVVGGIGFLTLALKGLPVSVAYPVWTAIGALGTVGFGYLVLGEALTPLKILSVVAIAAGVAGLKAAAA